MMPTQEMMSFFKAHGQHHQTTFAKVLAQRDFFLEHAHQMAQLGANATSAESKITAINEVAAACVGALAAGHGLEVAADEAVLRGEAALEVLYAELDLDPNTARPLHDLRHRASEISRGIPERSQRHPEQTDSVLARRSDAIGVSLLQWTHERLNEVALH